MYWPEVYDLAGFYQTELGKAAATRINTRLDEVLPLDCGTVLGVGYATPFLKDGKAFAAMPAAQGVLHWPEGDKNRSLVCKEADLPFEDDSINCAIVAHALEFTRKP